MPLPTRQGGRFMPPLAGAALVAILAAGNVLAASPVSAEPSGAAAAEAGALLAKVRVLQGQTATALQRYDTAVTQVASGVHASLDAAAAHRAAEGTAAQTQQVLDERVRTLYISGGRAGLYSSLLSNEGLEGFTSRVVVMQRLVSDSRRTASDSATAEALALSAAASARTQATTRIATASDVGNALARLEALLVQQERMLATANATVRRLRAIEAAAAALRKARASAAQVTAGGLRRLGTLPGSPEYFRLYRAAATTCPGLSWTVLAAIGQVETGHGRNTNLSSAGAQGPMQFMPGTFAAYGVDGNRDGRVDVFNAADAIFSAANYLCANGAGKGPAGLRNAVFRYNNANWYVNMVLALAGRYAASG